MARGTHRQLDKNNSLGGLGRSLAKRFQERLDVRKWGREEGEKRGLAGGGVESEGERTAEAHSLIALVP